VVWVNQAGQFDFAGAGPPVAALAGAPGGGGGHHGHPGAVDGDVELVWRRAAVGGCGQHGDLPARDGGRLSGDSVGRGGAVAFGGAFDPLARQPDSSQFGEQVGGGDERYGGRGAGGDAAQSRR
jgi:hypothetical protein